MPTVEGHRGRSSWMSSNAKRQVAASRIPTKAEVITNPTPHVFALASRRGDELNFRRKTYIRPCAFVPGRRLVHSNATPALLPGPLMLAIVVGLQLIPRDVDGADGNTPQLIGGVIWKLQLTCITASGADRGPI